jgi:hypothetical protein
MNELIKYTCPKCGNKQYETGEIWTISSFWTKMFEFYNRRFTFVSCQRCRYTELYKVQKKKLGETVNYLIK